MLNYELQKEVSLIVTKIMKKHHKLRRPYQVELVISDIEESSFKFEANGDFDEEIVRTYAVNIGGYRILPEYSEKNYAYFKFRTVIEKEGKPAVITYDVYMHENKVICNPDDYENSIHNVSADKFEFII